MIWLRVIRIIETKISLGIRRGGGMIRSPRARRKARRTAPARVQRRPAKTPGETVAMPTFIASQVVPQTKQMKTNIARCDVADEVFIGVADVLLPRRSDSASGWVGVAPKRHGAYACG